MAVLVQTNPTTLLDYLVMVLYYPKV